MEHDRNGVKKERTRTTAGVQSVDNQFFGLDWECTMEQSKKANPAEHSLYLYLANPVAEKNISIVCCAVLHFCTITSVCGLAEVIPSL